MKTTEIIPLFIFFGGAIAGSAYAIRRIWRTTDSRRWKIAFSLLATIPWLGPFAYFYLDIPPRQWRKELKQKVAADPVDESPLLTQWNEHEPVFLTWCGVVFLSCAVAAYWLNNWSPGHIHFGVLGVYTHVDQIFYTLLILAIFAFGGANRAKTYLEMRGKLEISGSDPQRESAKKPAPASRKRKP